MARINSYTKITGAPADSDCFIIDSTQGTAGTRIVLWSVLKSVLTGIFAPKAHKHPGSDITSAVANANAATNDSIGQNIASTYVKSITASGRTITVKRGNDTTFTFQTQDTTYGNMSGATTSAAGKAGLVPAPATGANNRYLRSDGTWAVPPDNNTTYGNMSGATTSAAGKAGLVPAPAQGASNRYLRSDGTWQVPPDTNTTYGNMSGATTSAAGKAGLVPAPATGANNRYLRSDGTWAVPPDTNTTYGNMSGATTSAAGKAGLVPAPATGASNRYLRSDGTWAVPPDNNTTYSVATHSANGLMSSADKQKLDGLSSDIAGSIPLATPSRDGLMPKADKAKLDAIGPIPSATIDGFFRI